MKQVIVYFIMCTLFSISLPTFAAHKNAASFVMQLTRSSENYGHRRAFVQLDKVLTDLGEENLNIEVVAYEEGIYALLSENDNTSQLISKLANRGVKFKVCSLSMGSQNLTEDEFPLEIEFIPAGAPEIINLQMKGYKYWRP